MELIIAAGSAVLVIFAFFVRYIVKQGDFMKILELVVFIDLFGVALVLPLMFKYATALGADATKFGLLGSIFAGSQLLGSPFMGWLSDRYGRKTALLINFTGAAGSYLTSAFAPTFLILCLARIPVGVVKQTMMISSAYAAQLTPTKQRSAAIGRLRSMISLAFVIGPTAGGFIASEIDLKAPALLSAMLFSFDFFIVFMYLPDVKVDHDHCPTKKKPSLMEKIRAAAKHPQLRVILAACVTMEFGGRLNRHALPVLTETLDLGPRATGIVWSTTAAVTTISGIAMGPLFHRFGLTDHLATMYSIPVACAMIFIWALSPSIMTFFSAYTSYMSAKLVTETCFSSMLTHTVSQNQVGATLGTLDSLNSMIGLVAPLIAGYLSEFDPTYPPLVSVLFTLLAYIPMRFLYTGTEHQVDEKNN
eukprot:TRINITY_DN6059_c5_g1_i1.p1 TRINITY_DN6059_c5_g1~~TRINITY_DN6059_c5_g1_i1.p1  ORF type:complete len:419 (+),score=48.44 TRINITY_DN6059_c5_g1_i1:78-1334(+)